MQAKDGLLGEIDEKATGNGKIVCKDGFTATTISENEFRELASAMKMESSITEVDESSLFCEIGVNHETI